MNKLKEKINEIEKELSFLYRDIKKLEKEKLKIEDLIEWIK